ncbi:aldehyde dehydrogenase family protein [Nonomuraea sp. NPDC049649]|uniref:aldehyde dehydrogenase family protein n=1 Tax=Nonomuraea sp. NPDC049649 TaxID=3155776 RepID=UPI00342FB654
MSDDFGNFIAGEWREPSAERAIEVENPTTLERLATVPDSSDKEVDEAVTAARDAFESWSQTPRAERVERLRRMGELMDERASTLAKIVVADLGAPAVIARKAHVGLARMVLADIADRLSKPQEELRIGNSRVIREPYGVVGAITPWNYPLYQVMAKIAPALGAGCTVVLKPSEVAPLAAYELTAIAEWAGIPAGVLNLVSGTGPVAGAALAAHPGVDLVSFTGSVTAGRAVAAGAGAQGTRTTLELGGKSAAVVLPDADLARAVKATLADVMLNSGQTCRALTRLVVHEDQYDEAVEVLVRETPKWTVGDPRDPSTRLGPLVSATQRDRVRDYIARALDDGARLIAGSAESPETGFPGHFVSPAVLGGVERDAEIAQEEVFGPVLVVLTYRDEDDAVAVANATQYGLSGAVWSGVEARAVAVARRLRTGQVDINGGRFNLGAPFGGYRSSGYGRELGPLGIEEFQQVKSLQF